MKRKEFKKSVWERVVSIMKRKGLNLKEVIIDRKNQIVSVGDCFFSQGESAQELIDQIPTDISDRVWMVFFLDSAGIL